MQDFRSKEDPPPLSRASSAQPYNGPTASTPFAASPAPSTSGSASLRTASPAPYLSAQRSRALFSAASYQTQESRAAHWAFIAAVKIQVDQVFAGRLAQNPCPTTAPSVAAQLDAGGGVPVTSMHGLFKTLKRLGKLRRVYSQNIDSFEELEGLDFVPLPGVTVGFDGADGSGVEVDRWARKKKRVKKEPKWKGRGDVVQLHGSLKTVRCTGCGWVGEWDEPCTVAFAAGHTLDCPACLARGELSRQIIPSAAPS